LFIIVILIIIKAILESTVAVDNRLDHKFVEDSLRYLEDFEQQSIEQTVRLMEKYDNR
jgi:hypothetical protein